MTAQTFYEGRVMKRKFFVFTTVGSILLVFTIKSAQAELKVGDLAPRFTVATTQDKPVNYASDYYGKYHLVLEFFPSDFGEG